MNAQKAAANAVLTLRIPTPGILTDFKDMFFLLNLLLKLP